MPITQMTSYMRKMDNMIPPIKIIKQLSLKILGIINTATNYETGFYIK